MKNEHFQIQRIVLILYYYIILHYSIINDLSLALDQYIEHFKTTHAHVPIIGIQRLDSTFKNIYFLLGLLFSAPTFEIQR